MKGQELLDSLRKSIDDIHDNMNNRAERIEEGSTDMDDCFVTQRIEETFISIDRMKIGILENKGLSSFQCLRDINTDEIVSIKIIDGKFGPCHLIMDEFVEKFGRFVGCAKREETYNKKGLKTSQFETSAWVGYQTNQGGMMGAYTAIPQIYMSRKNYWTGEFDKNYFINKK